jgi:hypothetical protein
MVEGKRKNDKQTSLRRHEDTKKTISNSTTYILLLHTAYLFKISPHHYS